MVGLLDRPASRWYAADSAVGLRSRQVVLVVRGEPTGPLNLDFPPVEQLHADAGGDLLNGADVAGWC